MAALLPAEAPHEDDSALERHGGQSGHKRGGPPEAHTGLLQGERGPKSTEANRKSKHCIKVCYTYSYTYYTYIHKSVISLIC